jgi:hypothetical protein
MFRPKAAKANKPINVCVGEPDGVEPNLTIITHLDHGGAAKLSVQSARQGLVGGKIQKSN